MKFLSFHHDPKRKKFISLLFQDKPLKILEHEWVRNNGPLGVEISVDNHKKQKLIFYLLEINFCLLFYGIVKNI